MLFPAGSGTSSSISEAEPYSTKVFNGSGTNPGKPEVATSSMCETAGGGLGILEPGRVDRGLDSREGTTVPRLTSITAEWV